MEIVPVCYLRSWERLYERMTGKVRMGRRHRSFFGDFFVDRHWETNGS